MKLFSKLLIVILIYGLYACSPLTRCERRLKSVIKDCPELLDSFKHKVVLDTLIKGVKIDTSLQLKNQDTAIVDSLVKVLQDRLQQQIDSDSLDDRCRQLLKTNDSLLQAILIKPIKKIITEPLFTDTIRIDTSGVHVRIYQRANRIVFNVVVDDKQIHKEIDIPTLQVNPIDKVVKEEWYKDMWFYIAALLFVILILVLIKKHG